MFTSETDRLSIKGTSAIPKRVEFGEFQLNIGQEYELPVSIKLAFESFLNTRFVGVHRKCSQPNKTVFQANTGLPSPVIRIDSSSIVDVERPEASIFEVEARPAGLGILTEMFGIVEPVRRVFELVSELSNMPIGIGVLPSVNGGLGQRDRSVDTQLLAKNVGLQYLYRPW